jgi:hypothetical protein
MSEDDKNVADSAAERKAAVEAERAKVVVTKVDIKDDDDSDKEVEAKDKDDDKENEQKDEGSEEEKEGEGDGDGAKEDDNKDDIKDEDKEELKADKKLERLEKKLAREAIRRREAEKREKELLRRLEAKPDKALTEEDVEARATAKAEREMRIKEFNSTVEKLVEGAQKHLKLNNKQMDSLIEAAQDDIGEPVPAEIVEALGDIDNGHLVLAHLLKNTDDAEDIYKLKNRHIKLGLELAKLSTKLSTPKQKPVSKVPDPPEPLGGKSAGGDRLAILASKKTLTSSEMDEYVQARNADVAKKRANGRMNLK